MNKNVYYAQGQDWHEEVNSAARRRARWMGIIAALSLVLAILCVGAFMALLPLKEHVPVIFEVDRATGSVYRVRPLTGEVIERTEVMINFFVNHYVILRETYDPHDLEENYERLALFSEKNLYREYEEMMQESNEDSPVNRFGRETIRSVEVTSIMHLNDRTSHVRFVSTDKRSKDAHGKKRYWVAVITWKWVERDLPDQMRLINPMGFMVTGYRRDQEIIDKPE